ncbi:PTS sugar transporter subunit IIB [Candidatus Enterococcus murrayae]|uniref:PTS sugar transporter subunit IIB n=1 Tax=Candidatus Enterococcus murrayae TaxID=2815321 RepID=A0ABS3HKP5_9ENTE|nr:PTS sugar transporter subunit IIB [Enterococcus sp. MJM16]MBO0453509.1 PTS sugar transporter subunit IIB [Enterococcus sp. MJM16]
MIKMTRIDYRLLHGQVAFAWTKNLSANAILIANDEVVNDSFRKQTLNLAKPNDTKLIFKSVEDSIKAIKSGVTDKYNVFIVVENVHDAYRMAKGTSAVDKVNLGLSAKREGTMNIAKAVYVSESEINELKELIDLGVEVLVKQAPNDTNVDFCSLIK